VTSVDAKDKFTIGESLWAIMLWPVLLIIFIHSFLQGLFESSGLIKLDRIKFCFVLSL